MARYLAFIMGFHTAYLKMLQAGPKMLSTLTLLQNNTFLITNVFQVQVLK